MQNAAESSAAFPSVDAAPHGPLRTCVGCRQRAAAADLLRVVVEAADIPGQPGRLRLDLRRSAPGRGAWLHPDSRCAELAERRRAFARALRVPAVSDASAVVALVDAWHPKGVTTEADERLDQKLQNRSSNRLAGRSRPTGDHEGEKKS